MNKKGLKAVNSHGLVNSRNLEVNYRKIWAKYQVSMPFYFAINIIREKWKLTYFSGSYSKARKNLSKYFKERLGNLDKSFLDKESKDYLAAVLAIKNLPILERDKDIALLSILANYPSIAFINDVKKLMNFFGFRDEWKYHLMLLIVTGKISAPDDIREDAAPPESVRDQIKMLELKTKKDVQHRVLKEHEFKTGGKNDGKKKTISELDSHNDFVPGKLIHDYTEIADEIFGEIDLDKISTKKFKREEKKRIGKIKIGLFRLKRSPYYQGLNQETANELLKIFS